MVCISGMVLVKDRKPLGVRILTMARVEMDYKMGKLENARFTFSSSARISLKSYKNLVGTLNSLVLSRRRSHLMNISNMFLFMIFFNKAAQENRVHYFWHCNQFFPLVSRRSERKKTKVVVWFSNTCNKEFFFEIQ